MSGMICHFHADEWSSGTRLEDGSVRHVCTRTAGHPDGGSWTWLEVPEPPASGFSGMADELDLAQKLPAALASLGEGWFEYGLVERAYAQHDPHGFAKMVQQWGHTAQGPQQYSASSYLAGTLGRLSRSGSVAYHPGGGTGRWYYNADISWWSTVPAGPWTARTSWQDVLGDDRANDQCKNYLPDL